MDNTLRSHESTPGRLLPSERRRNLGLQAMTGSRADNFTPWQLRGACNGEDPELFFPIGSTGPALRQIEKAKRICRTCPVIDRCRDYALNNEEAHGVWGGLSEKERDKIIKRRKSTTKLYGQ